MNIERDLVPVMTLEEFADANDLTLVITERDANTVAMAHIGEKGKFYAKFKDSSIGDGCTILRYGYVETYGDGATEKEAISNYSKIISEKMLIINAHDLKNRKEIKVPRIKSGVKP